MSLLKNLLPLMLALLTVSVLQSQEIWSLEKCIQYAQENSLSIKQAKYGVESALITERQSKHARYPNISASTGVNLQFGRTIDPTTNAFNTSRITSNSISLDGTLQLFNGNAINNQIKQSKLDTRAAIADAEAVGNDLGLNIASAYLSILLAYEQVENAQKQLELSQEQLKQTDRLIQAGSLPENDRYDILARIALDEQTLIDAKNQIGINMLTLKQLMEVDPSLDFEIERPDVIVPTDSDPNAYEVDNVYNLALDNQPQIKANELRLESAELGVTLARANTLPSVFLFGGLSTGYSSAARTVDGGSLVFQEQPAFFNGDPFTLGLESFDPNFVDNPYGDQLNENFGQRVGVSVNIPIYNNYRNKASIERAKVNILNTKVTNQQTKQTLKTNIQRAVADALASKESLEASEKSLEAAKVAFDNATKRFDLGAINTFEYSTARNNLDQADNNFIISKYQYVFNLKVVDFYLGKPLKID